MKTCSKCGEAKSNNQFSRSICKSCNSKRQKEYRNGKGREAIKKSRRKSKLLNSYGITESEWMDRFNARNGRCAVCKNEAKRLCVDHYHIKGYDTMAPQEKKKYWRGLICWRCNYFYLARGMNIEMAESVMTYLQEYENYADRFGK